MSTVYPVLDFATSMLEKALGAGLSSGAGMAFGKVLTLVGIGGPDLGAVVSKLDAISTSLTGLQTSLDGVADHVDLLLVEAALTRTELLEKIDSARLSQSLNVIRNQYANFCAFEPAMAATVAGRPWAQEMAAALSGHGAFDIDQLLYDVHAGTVGGPHDSGLLHSCTQLLLARVQQQKVPMEAAYGALEALFADLLGVQACGLMLAVEALNWRDTAAAQAGGAAAAPQLLAFPGDARRFVTVKFNPHIEEQVDLFLRCTDRLVATGLDLRTERWGFIGRQAQTVGYLPAAAENVYARADHLARSACPQAHGFDIVGRLIGDPGPVLALVGSADVPAPVPQFEWMAPIGAHHRGPAAVVPVMPAPQPMQWLPLAGALLHEVGPEELALPADRFPAGAYLQWQQRADGNLGCRPQNRVAFVRIGLRHAPAPAGGNWFVVRLPGMAATGRLMVPDMPQAPLVGGPVAAASAGSTPGPAPAAAAAEPPPARGCFLWPLRGEPAYEDAVFQGPPKHPHEHPLPLYRPVLADEARRTVLRFVPEGAWQGMVLAARYTVAERLDYAPVRTGHGPPYNVRTRMDFAFALGSSTEAAWLTQQLRPYEKTAPAAEVALRPPGWVSVTRPADTAATDAAPPVVDLALWHSNSSSLKPEFWDKGCAGLPDDIVVKGEVLQAAWVWLADVGLAVMPAPK